MNSARRVPHSMPVTGSEEIEAVECVLRSGQLAQGREVEAFEQECAAFVDRKYAVAVNSGTAALHLTLLGMGMGPKYAVAMPSYVCTALLNAAEYTGASALICDVGPDFNLEDVPPPAAAAIVTHLFGKASRVPSGVPAIEDLAQSIGGSTGREGVAAVASFYATKLMTTGGEGGMILTDHADIAEFARERRAYDNRDAYVRRYNYKMTDIAAAVGRVQLAKLPQWIARRREIAEAYSDGFRGLPLTLPDLQNHVCFRYVVLTERREDLESHLNRSGIEAKRPVFKPLHHYDLSGINAKLAPSYPQTDAAHQHALSIPLNPAMPAADITLVVDSVKQFFEA